MKRNSYSILAFAAVMALGVLASSLAVADTLTCPGTTPAPNSAVVTTRVYNDCPGSTLSYTNSYPSLVEIKDADDGCTGTNLHVWSFSEDGVTAAAFENCSHYQFGAVLKFDATTGGEAGLRVSPWWSPNVDGRFMVKPTEIACFGGRLPFYSFTSAYGLTYTPGAAIWLQITYDPNELSEAAPATIEYKLYYQGVGYTSGPLAFDMGNETEGPTYGLWGELYPAYVGGYVQAPNWNGGATFDYSVRWENIAFEGPTATPTSNSTWGQLKAIYR